MWGIKLLWSYSNWGLKAAASNRANSLSLFDWHVSEELKRAGTDRPARKSFIWSNLCCLAPSLLSPPMGRVQNQSAFAWPPYPPPTRLPRPAPLQSPLERTHLCRNCLLLLSDLFFSLCGSCLSCARTRRAKKAPDIIWLYWERARCIATISIGCTAACLPK